MVCDAAAKGQVEVIGSGTKSRQISETFPSFRTQQSLAVSSLRWFGELVTSRGLRSVHGQVFNR